MRAAGPFLGERDYPAATPPIQIDAPQLFFSTGEPAENFFDLRNPAERDVK